MLQQPLFMKNHSQVYRNFESWGTIITIPLLHYQKPTLLLLSASPSILFFVLIEAGVGFYIHSLALLSDAAHNLADVGTLALSLLAFRLLKVKANDQYTYGYRKTSILVEPGRLVSTLQGVGGIPNRKFSASFARTSVPIPNRD